MPKTAGAASYSRNDIVGILKMYRLLVRRGDMTQEEIYKQISEVYGRGVTGIRALIARMAPTTDLARDYIRSSAFRLAARAVRKANVQESLDMLSRPEIGVLTPKQVGPTNEGPRGFFLTVTTDSCGAVKASAAMVEGVPNANPGSTIQSEDGAIWDQGALGLQGEQGGGSEESGDGGDPHPGGVSAGQAETDGGLQETHDSPQGTFMRSNKKVEALKERLRLQREARQLQV